MYMRFSGKSSFAQSSTFLALNDFGYKLIVMEKE